MIRPATMADVPEIHRLINYHAEYNRMLFRSHANLYEHLRDFFVAIEPLNGQEKVVACVALELVWRDLAEIKSLAVADEMRGGGIGARLVQATLEEARRLKLATVFALTRETRFFDKLGFHIVPRETLPHKVWTDCVQCPLQMNCDEVAMVIELEA
ncbi:MAG TPA: N-acetyltransferase [Phycisphaerae bacterium]|nr:N-acetyltransferase [Phycisphaerae bacterium]